MLRPWLPPPGPSDTTTAPSWAKPAAGLTGHTITTYRKSPRAPSPAAVLKTLRARGGSPYVVGLAKASQDPFRTLVACVLSLRTRDETTEAATRRLFRRARSPRGVLKLTEAEIAALIRPVAFYKTKAGSLRALARQLLGEHGGRVPDDYAALVALAGVGPKTANLVLGACFGVPAICVDTHVHRVPNRLGWIDTASPEESQAALEAALPKRHWIELNPLLVAFGQTTCLPVSPRCSECPFEGCPRVGVARSR